MSISHYEKKIITNPNNFLGFETGSKSYLSHTRVDVGNSQFNLPNYLVLNSSFNEQ